MTTKIKIGIVGSRAYTNKNKIKELIFEIKEKYGNSVEIVSGGQREGADGFAKKFALMFGLNYVEFPPSHYNWNMHCVLPASQYNKQYYVSNYFKRNKQIAEYSDIIVAFIQPGVESRGTRDTIRHAEKEKKLVKIIEQYIFIYVYTEVIDMDYKLTSVKVLKDLYRNFKSKTFDDEFTLQKLVNRSMDLYVCDEEFRGKIQEYNNLIPSGSRL